MRDALGPGTTLGYCTNVHAGATLSHIRDNLERFALPVKQNISPGQPMGVGLWFSAAAVRELIDTDDAKRFGHWLADRGLLAYTVNGFPFADFHRPVVKHDVYRPDWADVRRYHYTRDLARLLADLLPPDAAEGSISTLPLGWPSGDANVDEARIRDAAAHLTRLVHDLARLELDTGKHIHVNLEPEPGCLLDTAADAARFFHDHLLGTPDEISVRGYLGVCHDVCHAAVMFEPQNAALAVYRDAGLRVGKAQLSAAIRVPFDTMDAATRRDTLHHLARFAEERYLHQTMIRTDDGRLTFHDDLPDALRLHPDPGGEWRVHFHVPVHLDALGPLATTRPDLAAFLGHLRPDDGLHHFEVETYTRGVLPDPLRRDDPDDLAEGLAAELRSVMAVSR